jgi:hypothetical protein
MTRRPWLLPRSRPPAAAREQRGAVETFQALTQDDQRALIELPEAL